MIDNNINISKELEKDVEEYLIHNLYSHLFLFSTFLFVQNEGMKQK